LQEEGRLSEAGEHYRAALKVQAHSATAQLNLGGLHEELGEMSEAEVAFRAALSVRPGLAIPHARLATLLRGRLPDSEQILAGHPCIHGAGELRLARQTFESIPVVLAQSEAPLACIPQLDGEATHRLADQHLDGLKALDAGRAARIADKMPDNYLYLGLLAALFPRATFFHCRRDLRDVAVSCWMTDFRSIRWASDPEHIATRFQQYRRVTDHWRKVVPVPIHEVHYEDTVSDLEGVARRVIAACGLEWDSACLDFHRVRRPIRTASVTQVRQPIYKSPHRRTREPDCPGHIQPVAGHDRRRGGQFARRDQPGRQQQRFQQHHRPRLGRPFYRDRAHQGNHLVRRQQERISGQRRLPGRTWR
jgi:hypothetical protein